MSRTIIKSKLLDFYRYAKNAHGCPREPYVFNLTKAYKEIRDLLKLEEDGWYKV